ncbi:MAG: DUF456 domain-containing protein, partial [Spirosomataceae bacterium]
MDIVLLILGVIALIVGTIGAVLPLPGPPLSYIGLLLIHATRFANFSSTLLWTLGLITAAVLVLDYYIPIWGTKQLGGSKYGSWGSAIGMVVGLFLGPFGLFIGAFAGALIGELLHGAKFNTSLKAAIGTFLGFAVGIVMKLSLCVVMIFYVIQAIWR